MVVPEVHRVVARRASSSRGTPRRRAPRGGSPPTHRRTGRPAGRCAPACGRCARRRASGRRSRSAEGTARSGLGRGLDRVDVVVVRARMAGCRGRAPSPAWRRSPPCPGAGLPSRLQRRHGATSISDSAKMTCTSSSSGIRPRDLAHRRGEGLVHRLLRRRVRRLRPLVARWPARRSAPAPPAAPAPHARGRPGAHPRRPAPGPGASARCSWAPASRRRPRSTPRSRDRARPPGRRSASPRRG